ncbi:phage holin family protein [Paenarthrobacter sp. AR 02]|uniref:phage holin family protein n=1 Tax=Paenarthrobacter sp. AR 02 TaxID=2899821 RepID=UPI001F381725|nr:phage holin family protein [Paenarthrobacter sp. AR 02]MCF3138530.1 phage holin family protein [Paenarthrobacter sp. AR 02]
MSSPADLPPTTAHVKAETLPLGELLSDVTRDISTLMRQEVELAKAEIKDSASKAGKGAGMLGGAAYAGHITVLFLSIALWWALGLLVGLGWSALIVAVIWGIIAAVLASVGRKELKAIKGLPRTAETVKEIPPALKPNTEETR